MPRAMAGQQLAVNCLLCFRFLVPHYFLQVVKRLKTPVENVIELNLVKGNKGDYLATN